MINPIRKVFDVRKGEFPVAILLFGFFFLVIAVFQMLRPLKKGLLIEHYGAHLELYAKLGNIVVAGIAVTVFTYLYNRLPRQRLIYTLCLFFIGCFLWLTYALNDSSALAIWSFYLLGDLVTTVMVAGFWAYATDLATPDQAKRLFGVIGGGGIIGGFAGISLTRILLQELGMSGLLLLAAGLMGMVILATYLIEKLTAETDAFQNASAHRQVQQNGTEQKSKMMAALEGAQLVRRSKYLASIVGIMAFYEMASQVMDFQFSSLAEGLSGVEGTQAFLAQVGFYANGLAVVVQFFLVSFIMRRLGLVTALLILPVAIFGSSAAFVAMSTLGVASLLYISDNGINYSVQQTARESLYVVTSPDDKYKARAFTNMFVQRLAKGLSILLVMMLGMLRIEISTLSVITITVAILMAIFSIYAGREFARRSVGAERGSEVARQQKN